MLSDRAGCHRVEGSRRQCVTPPSRRDVAAKKNGPGIKQVQIVERMLANFTRGGGMTVCLFPPCRRAIRVFKCLRRASDPSSAAYFPHRARCRVGVRLIEFPAGRRPSRRTRSGSVSPRRTTFAVVRVGLSRQNAAGECSSIACAADIRLEPFELLIVMHADMRNKVSFWHTYLPFVQYSPSYPPRDMPSPRATSGCIPSGIRGRKSHIPCRNQGRTDSASRRRRVRRSLSPRCRDRTSSSCRRPGSCRRTGSAVPRPMRRRDRCRLRSRPPKCVRRPAAWAHRPRDAS